MNSAVFYIVALSIFFISCDLPSKIPNTYNCSSDNNSKAFSSASCVLPPEEYSSMQYKRSSGYDDKSSLPEGLSLADGTLLSSKNMTLAFSEFDSDSLEGLSIILSGVVMTKIKGDLESDCQYTFDNLHIIQPNEVKPIYYVTQPAVSTYHSYNCQHLEDLTMEVYDFWPKTHVELILITREGNNILHKDYGCKESLGKFSKKGALSYLDDFIEKAIERAADHPEISVKCQSLKDK